MTIDQIHRQTPLSLSLVLFEQSKMLISRSGQIRCLFFLSALSLPRGKHVPYHCFFMPLLRGLLTICLCLCLFINLLRHRRVEY